MCVQRSITLIFSTIHRFHTINLPYTLYLLCLLLHVQHLAAVAHDSSETAHQYDNALTYNQLCHSVLSIRQDNAAVCAADGEINHWVCIPSTDELSGNPDRYFTLRNSPYRGWLLLITHKSKWNRPDIKHHTLFITCLIVRDQLYYTTAVEFSNHELWIHFLQQHGSENGSGWTINDYEFMSICFLATVKFARQRPIFWTYFVSEAKKEKLGF